jgi:hypothetical protein
VVGAGNTARPVFDGCLCASQHDQTVHSSGDEKADAASIEDGKQKQKLAGGGSCVCVSRRAQLDAAEVEVEAEKGPSEGGSQRYGASRDGLVEHQT